MTIPRTLIALALTAAAWPANAVITRDDVPVSQYAARAARLPSYCQLQLPDGGGVLIARDWVLTAAHLAPIKRGQHILCGGEDLVVAEMIRHPAYDDNVGRHDIALLRLAAPSAQPLVPLWPRPIAAGSIVELIGHYQGGTGLTGGVGRNPAGLRAATNRVTKADGHWLRLVMDKPGSADVTPFEGVSGGGDSGAPLFIVKNGRLYVVGVGSRNSDSNDDGIEQNYGDTDMYVPVASYAGWIDRVVNGHENKVRTKLDSLVEYGSASEIVSAAGGVLAALVAVAAAITRRRRSRTKTPINANWSDSGRYGSATVPSAAIAGSARCGA